MEDLMDPAVQAHLMTSPDQFDDMLRVMQGIPSLNEEGRLEPQRIQEVEYSRVTSDQAFFPRVRAA
ncbi:hypothetical protein D3C81_1949320 [compost metagenome]